MDKQNIPPSIDPNNKENTPTLLIPNKILSNSNSKPPIVIGNEFFVYNKHLGAGSDGRAELFATAEGKVVVVKTCRRGDSDTSNDDYIPHENRVLQLLRPYNHPHLATYIGTRLRTPIPKEDGLIMEYCNMGDLQKYKTDISNQEQAIPEANIWKIFQQTASALAFLHTGFGFEHSQPWLPILHRDIKPTNICLHRYPNGVVVAKLMDFGSAAQYTPGMIVDFNYDGGTMDYNPPEYPMATEAGDVWGMGAVIHYMALMEPPVNSFAVDAMEITDDDEWRKMLPRNALHINRPPHERQSQWDFLGNASEPWEGVYSGDLDMLMHMALTLEPENRATALDLLNYMWFLAHTMPQYGLAV